MSAESKLKLYLDSCALQRPFDDASQLRVRIEADAVTELIAAFEKGDVLLIGSDVLNYEIAQIPEANRREPVERLLRLRCHFVTLTKEIEVRAAEFEKYGIKAFDAYHLASAIAANADYFCTTDDRFRRKAFEQQTGLTQVVSPLELIENIKI